MATDPTSAPASEIEQAIAQVLAAERAAHADIAAARADAQRRVDAARADARALSERTQRRLQRLHRAFERGTAAEIATLQALARQHQRDAAPADDEARVEAAVVRLAAALTGESP